MHVFFNICQQLSHNSRVTSYVLHTSQALCAACEPYFVCWMIVRNTQVRLRAIHMSKTSCAACESVFLYASLELTTMLCQIRIKVHNEMAKRDKMCGHV